MNSVILMGRLTKDPETKTAGKTTYTKFSLAVDRRFRKEGGADFPSCVAFGKTADFINKYFRKGMKMCLEGRLQTGSYTNKDGAKVYTTDVIVDNCEFAEGKKADAPEKKEDDFMEVSKEDEENLPF